MPETEKKKDLPAVPFDQKAMVYTAADGQEIRLNIDMVKKYLITPIESADKVTPQEFVFFLNICKSRGLNPFIKDVYPVKYGSEPLAIITSIEFLRKRAAAEPDCEGWDKGVIVQKRDGALRESHGLVLEDEKLVGGWFRGYKTGWKHDFYLEVNLKAYIKKTREGKITKFWEEDNQPTMIAKVAEAQGLRTMWPGKFSKMYLAEEIGSPDYEIPEIPTEIPEVIDLKTMGRFDELVKGKDLNEEDIKIMGEFLEAQSKKNKKTVDEMKAMAERDFDNFFEYFIKFKAKREAAKKEETLFDQNERGEGEKPTK